MPISIGDTLPSVSLFTNGEKGPEPIQTSDFFKGRKVVLFGVPGAFTPGCSNAHMPGFVVSADKLGEKGIDAIACMAVNDAFVLGAWQKSQNAENITMLADGNGELTRALGLEMDGSGFGLGNRCQRFALIADNGVVTYVGVDEKGIEKSAADAVMAQL
ncbi:MAG: peroxiredoxin [Halomonadaceae bacterium]|nr:MAG: peroxiredoxin [Halomonadaceae bacterium]